VTCELLNNDKDNHGMVQEGLIDDFDGTIKITSDQYANIEEMIHVFEGLVVELHVIRIIEMIPFFIKRLAASLLAFLERYSFSAGFH
jgi:hypothetical protein